MPPHLHPRSRTTSSLFATTLVASFVVVALPHLLPCPAPRTKYADGPDGVVVVDDSGRRRRLRRREHNQQQQPVAEADREGLVQFGSSGDRVDAPRRECPVPKPGGVLGEWLGFGRGSG